MVYFFGSFVFVGPLFNAPLVAECLLSVNRIRVRFVLCASLQYCISFVNP